MTTPTEAEREEAEACTEFTPRDIIPTQRFEKPWDAFGDHLIIGFTEELVAALRFYTEGYDNGERARAVLALKADDDAK
jgi:hypothetical protein